MYTIMTNVNREKNCLILLCMHTWSLFRNAIATLPSQNNDILHVNIPYLLYSVYSNRMQPKKIPLHDFLVKVVTLYIKTY